MAKYSNTFLIGYRATGKTVVGNVLAVKLNKEFIDTYVLVEKKAGTSIKEIVEKEGWRSFRSLEQKVIKQVSSEENKIVALGGGALCHEFTDIREENRKMAKENGRIILLKADPETIFSRMQGDSKTEGQRPSLTDKGPFEEIISKLKERERSILCLSSRLVN